MIITDDNIQFIRALLPKYEGKLGVLQQSAYDEGIPAVPHETARFLGFLVGILKPVRILEIGTAVGFSSALFCCCAGKDVQITTIDRYGYMIEKAKKNFEYMGITDKVTLLEGDAADILPNLNDEYDFIFLDAAKGQYINYLPHIMRLLKKGCVFAADDVLSAGGVMGSRYDTPRRQRTTHKRLRNFLWELNARNDIEMTLIPIGGGMALCRKIE